MASKKTNLILALRQITVFQCRYLECYLVNTSRVFRPSLEVIMKDTRVICVGRLAYVDAGAWTMAVAWLGVRP